MKNLALFQRQCVQLRPGDGEFIGAAADGEHSRVFFVSRLGGLGCFSLLEQKQDYIRISNGAEPLDVVAMEYVMELESLLIALYNGDLMLADPASGSVEVVGELEGGVRSMSTSPDGSLVALATGAGMLLVMTLDWDILYEFPFVQLDGTSIASGGVEIMWRPDGKYFATNYRNAANGTSVIKIWDREAGTLHSSCKELPSRSTAISWYVGGARIAVACSNHATSSTTVVIFELNGLEKDRFDITAPKDAVVDALQWNSNGELLSVVLRCSKWDVVQLWSCSNYHWYLKQEWRYQKEYVVRMLWHPERPYCAIVWTSLGDVEVLQIGWKSAVLASSTAVVVDGHSVLVTPLAMSLVPPPMYAFKVNFSAVVNVVAASRDASVVAAGLSDGTVSVVAIDGVMDRDVEGRVLKNFSCYVKDLAFVGTHRLCGVLKGGDFSDRKEIFEVKLSESFCTAEKMWETSTGAEVVSLIGSSSSEVFINLRDGTVVTPDRVVVETFSQPCPWVQLVERDDQKPLLIGLEEIGKLHVGGFIVSEDCTSFEVHGTSRKSNKDAFHLIYTTKQDLLHVVNLDGNLAAPMVETVEVPRRNGRKPAAAVENDFNVRKVWERGSRLVGTLGGSDVAVILQTKRGNLETIYPRGLILEAISSSLTDNDFGEAVLCARRHRIDLNVIVDFLGEAEFSNRASDFVKQISLAHITELVGSLRKDNVLKTTYGKTLSRTAASGMVETGDNKVGVVLQALRTAVEREIPDSPSRELCLLTILARNDPPLLEEGLKRIKKVREMELSPLIRGRDGILSSGAALKHLIWLVDAEVVFNSALGLYDLHLAAMVASHSQRDPKEFLPFLQELEDMPPPLMRYTVDLKLERYDGALRNLASAGDDRFTACLELIKQHPTLYPVALEIFRDESKRLLILEQWGDHHLAEEKFEDAGLAFWASSKLVKAMAAYRAGGLWQSVLVVAGQLNMPSDELNRLASELRDELQAMGKPKEAARIALDYCKDTEGAVSHLIDARDWIEVLRCCYLYGGGDLVERVVKPSAEECAAALMSQFEEGLEKLGKYVARFKAVQQRRLAMEAKMKSEAANREGLEDDQETVSDASSTNLSGMSVYTRGSSRATNTTGKGRNRHPGRIRAGSPGEELALVEHLKGMAASTQLVEEVRPLLKLLVFIGEEKLASKLQLKASRFEAAHVEAVRNVDDSVQIEQCCHWSYDVLHNSGH